MRRIILGIGIALAVEGVIAVGGYYLVAPRLNWSAAQQPSAWERSLALKALVSWVRLNAPDHPNPFAAKPDNLKSGEDEYNEHCASCHGLDGSGRNQFEADFYPPVPKLTGGVQIMTDSQIFFMIKEGIRNTPMPSFGAHHEPDEIWKIVLWIRHLAHLNPEEKTAIESRMRERGEEHEKVMQKGQHDHHHHGQD